MDTRAQRSEHDDNDAVCEDSAGQYLVSVISLHQCRVGGLNGAETRAHNEMQLK